MRTPLTAGVGPGRISGRGGEGRARLRAHRRLTRISSPPRAPVGTVWSGVTSSLSRTGLGRPRRSATFCPRNTREDSFSPTSYPSPRSAGIRLPVAAYSSGRDMDRNCGWGPGGEGPPEWLECAVLATRCQVPAPNSEAGKAAQGSPWVWGGRGEGIRTQSLRLVELCLPNYFTTVGPVSERSRLSRPCILPGPRRRCKPRWVPWGAGVPGTEPPREGKQLTFVALRVETRT